MRWKALRAISKAIPGVIGPNAARIDTVFIQRDFDLLVRRHDA
jgi:hypothetical protein